MTLAESGARASELVSTTIGNLTFDNLGARLTIGADTDERSVRLVRSVPDLQLWLNHHPLRDDPKAPLFVGYRMGRPEPLMQEGVRAALKRAVQVAGIKKHVHPHLFRHTRFTELSKSLRPDELEPIAGWLQGSPMYYVYVHMNTEDVDKKILQLSGVMPKEETPKVNELAPKPCPRAPNRIRLRPCSARTARCRSTPRR